MGYYIEAPTNKGKAAYLVDALGGEVVEAPDFDAVPPGKALICVVDNGAFEAAAFAYDEQEFAEFYADDSGRPRTWVMLDWDIAARESGYDVAAAQGYV